MDLLRAAGERRGAEGRRPPILRHFEGYGNDEIARMLGMSRAVVGVKNSNDRKAMPGPKSAVPPGLKNCDGAVSR